MTRILFAFVATLVCNSSLACEEYRLPEGFQDFLASRGLAYQWPVGRFTEDRKVKCSLTQDFNNDGKPDFAGLYLYNGAKKRGSDKYLDLVIMYTVENSIEYTVYSYAGQFDKKNGIVKAYVEEISPGVIDTDPGEFLLNTPAIRLVRMGRDNRTYYWNGRKFTELVIGD